MQQESNKLLEQSRSDLKYFMAVGLLLVIIIATLAVLWVTERNRHRADVSQLVALQDKYVRLHGAMGEIIRSRREEFLGPIRREELATETIRWNGRARTVLRLTAADGERFGFRGGDVILVDHPRQTTRPADK